MTVSYKKYLLYYVYNHRWWISVKSCFGLISTTDLIMIPNIWQINDNNCFFDWEVLAIKYSNFEVDDIALHFETWNLLDFQTKHSKNVWPLNSGTTCYLNSLEIKNNAQHLQWSVIFSLTPSFIP